MKEISQNQVNRLTWLYSLEVLLRKIVNWSKEKEKRCWLGRRRRRKRGRRSILYYYRVEIFLKSCGACWTLESETWGK